MVICRKMGLFCVSPCFYFDMHCWQTLVVEARMKGAAGLSSNSGEMTVGVQTDSCSIQTFFKGLVAKGGDAVSATAFVLLCLITVSVQLPTPSVPRRHLAPSSQMRVPLHLSSAPGSA